MVTATSLNRTWESSLYRPIRPERYGLSASVKVVSSAPSAYASMTAPVWTILTACSVPTGKTGEEPVARKRWAPG